MPSSLLAFISRSIRAFQGHTDIVFGTFQLVLLREICRGVFFFFFCYLLSMDHLDEFQPRCQRPHFAGVRLPRSQHDDFDHQERFQLPTSPRVTMHRWNCALCYCMYGALGLEFGREVQNSGDIARIAVDGTTLRFPAIFLSSPTFMFCKPPRLLRTTGRISLCERLLYWSSEKLVLYEQIHEERFFIVRDE